MRRTDSLWPFSWAKAPLALLGLAGCPRSEAGVADDVAAVLRVVQDSRSAREAATQLGPHVDALGAALEEAKRRAESQPHTKKQRGESGSWIMTPEFVIALGRVREQVDRIANQAGLSASLKDLVARIRSKMPGG